MGIAIIGNGGTVAEVETNTRAVRVIERPLDVGSLGSYLLSQDNGTTVMTAGLAANSPIFSWRWGNANVAIVNAIRLSMCTITAFAAGRIAFQAFKAGGASFTASDTGGTTITITGNNAKKRQSFGTTLLSDARISATGTLSAGTRTLDANPFGELLAASVVASANPIFIQQPIYLRDTADQYPMTFAQNEGFVIQAAVPATGTWFFAVTVDWTELASY
jgi:hypothetical protein